MTNSKLTLKPEADWEKSLFRFLEQFGILPSEFPFQRLGIMSVLKSPKRRRNLTKTATWRGSTGRVVLTNSARNTGLKGKGRR